MRIPISRSLQKKNCYSCACEFLQKTVSSIIIIIIIIINIFWFFFMFVYCQITLILFFRNSYLYFLAAAEAESEHGDLMQAMNDFVREYLTSTPFVTVPSFAPSVTVNNQRASGILIIIIIIIIISKTSNLWNVKTLTSVFSHGLVLDVLDCPTCSDAPSTSSSTCLCVNQPSRHSRHSFIKSTNNYARKRNI